MPVFEVTSRVTRRSLMNRTKDELAHQVMELLCELDIERARHAADAKALRAVIQHVRPGANIVRVDEPTTGHHRYELWTNLTPKPAGHAVFLSEVRGVAWTDGSERTRDTALPAVWSAHG
ncbi:hypothetical protein AFCDBAGC_1043 [Methylobacterium cerastii]|uniref:Uncharacterized protein n=1 Tax=Methylobacterium cerastii TaxID=932741 RepID=A0ABQ4QDM8_9HYPH|nr:hypothetical protein AFCDBAGC_1043 [Methylobacterium cerastii]